MYWLYWLYWLHQYMYRYWLDGPSRRRKKNGFDLLLVVSIRIPILNLQIIQCPGSIHVMRTQNHGEFQY